MAYFLSLEEKSCRVLKPAQSSRRLKKSVGVNVGVISPGMKKPNGLGWAKSLKNMVGTE